MLKDLIPKPDIEGKLMKDLKKIDPEKRAEEVAAKLISQLQRLNWLPGFTRYKPPDLTWSSKILITLSVNPSAFRSQKPFIANGNVQSSRLVDIPGQAAMAKCKNTQEL